MLRTRIIPALLLREQSLVKTVRFGRFRYVGDPANTVRIFNELEVDELLFLDITATVEGRGPNLEVLRDIADECFMPVAYGGGIRSLSDASAVFDTGFEKVAVNSHGVRRPELVSEIARHYGSQAVIAAVDVKKDFLGRRRIRTSDGIQPRHHTPSTWAKELESRGAGELLLTSVDREGTWSGFDLDMYREVSRKISIPVIAHGGAGRLSDISEVVAAGASAVALGSMVVFQRQGMGVLVNFPTRGELEATLGASGQ